MLLLIAMLITCIKFLLIPSYHSTDFEVHRNWLAITYNLPLQKWYFENTSEWTLDYPPIFAWFEYCLSLIAQYFDKNMLIIENLNFHSPETILFQRISVIITDFVYVYGVKQCCDILPKSWQTTIVLPVLLLANVGFLIVDHIHFQYNGILFGFLLLSITKLLKDQYIQSAFLFTILLNMKHIFIYLAPAYFIYMLRNYCMKGKTKVSLIFANLLKLGGVVISIFLAAFIPFSKHINQVFSRMFPFKRGLCHAYWAPNIWALYNMLDKLAVFIGNKFSFNFTNTTASMTGGLVQEYSHVVLPTVTPIMTVTITALFMMPGMIKLWSLGRSPLNFIRYLIICALTSFLFGWHVHEKAILMPIVPLSILAIIDAEDARIFLILSTTGFYSLFPLLFPDNLLLLKAVLLITYSGCAFYSLCNLYPLKKCKLSLPLLNLFESLYILGLIPLFLYENIVHPYLRLNVRLPFLPLMLISVYCSIGVTYTWCKYYINFILKTK